MENTSYTSYLDLCKTELSKFFCDLNEGTGYDYSSKYYLCMYEIFVRENACFFYLKECASKLKHDPSRHKKTFCSKSGDHEYCKYIIHRINFIYSNFGNINFHQSTGFTSRYAEYLNKLYPKEDVSSADESEDESEDDVYFGGIFREIQRKKLRKSEDESDESDESEDESFEEILHRIRRKFV